MVTSTLDQIRVIDETIRNLEVDLATVTRSEREWRLQVKPIDACNFILKAKREACESDRLSKLNKANSLKAQMTDIQSQIVDLKRQRATLVSIQDSTNQANVALAQNGQSLEAMLIEAEGNASASQIAALTKSKDELEDGNLRRQIIVGTIIVLGVAVIIVIVVKARNMKGKLPKIKSKSKKDA